MTSSVSLEQLRQNNWIAIHGRVYDIAEFDDHPGGKDILLSLAGKDATADFEETGHTDQARKQALNFFVGFLEGHVGVEKGLPSVVEVLQSEQLNARSSLGLSTGTMVVSGMVALLGAMAAYFVLGRGTRM